MRINRRLLLKGAASTCFLSHRAFAGGWARGAVSLTYDDGLASHLDIAAPALEARGFRGTFYVTWDNIAPRADEWAALGRRGHELADHTVHHPCDIGHIGAEAFERTELRPMETWLDKVAGTGRARDYAYPCDVTDLGPGSAKQEAKRYHRLLRSMGIASARSSEGPPNPRSWARAHPYRLQALAAGYDAPTLLDVLNYVQRARAERRWAVVVFHGLAEGSSARDGCFSAADHAALLGELSASGTMVRTVGQMIGDLAGARS